MHSVKLRSLAIVMAVGGAGMTAHAQSPRARTPPPAAADVQRAIDRAKAFLYARQKPDGHWENVASPSPAAEQPSVDGGQWGGLTAIATYALLAAGESLSDPRIEKAVAFLRETQSITGTYAVGMRAQVWQYLPENEANKRAIARDGRLLLEAVNRQGPARGLYRYGIRPNGDWDHSASQIAVLGVWALTEAGFEVPADYWQMVDAAWRANQRNGGWAYDLGRMREGDITPAMTAAGVATLFLTQDFLHAAEGLNCRGNISNRSIDDGLRWMGQNFDRATGLYALYGVERIGVASGFRLLGDRDWYALGARRVLASQQGDGSWPESTGGPVPNTSFGLLFLLRGRAPIVMNKLEYDLAPASPPLRQSPGGTATRPAGPRPGGPAPGGVQGGAGSAAAPRPGNWNQRPRDAANVVRFVSKQSERALNWQITDLSGPAEDLLDSQILYIAGNQPLSFTPDDEAKLKAFVEKGGLILANADCNAPAFSTAFRALGKRLFPAYDFRELPEDHPIYTRQQFRRSNWKVKPNVLSLGNDVREFMLLLPNGDPARTWQANDLSREPVFQLTANLFSYSVDKTFARTKGESYLIAPQAGTPAQRELRVARLSYPGNWSPEPAGFPRLAAHLLNTRRVGLKADEVALGGGGLKGFQLAHLTGTSAFKPDDKQLAELKAFVEAGGTLLIDAAGGTEAFGVALEDALVKTFGDALKEPLKPDAPIYRVGGKPIDIAYRAYARTFLAGSETRSGRLRGAQVGAGGGWVFFSREDLSAGLVGMQIDGIHGYAPQTALELTSNVALWALGDRPN